MTISNSLANSLSEVFTFRDADNTRYNYHPRKTGLSLVCHNVGGRLIVPAILNSELPSAVSHNSLADNIVVPITNNNYMEIKKTADSIINIFFSHMGRRMRSSVSCVIDTTKGYKYIGGKGYILTEEGKPLIICGYEVKGGIFPVYEHPVCIINPEVFQREDMISKCIVKKIIPYYTEYDIYSGTGTFNRNATSRRAKVVITPEINSLVHKTVEPQSIDVDDTLYAILDANVHRVVR